MKSLRVVFDQAAQDADLEAIRKVDGVVSAEFGLPKFADHPHASVCWELDRSSAIVQVNDDKAVSAAREIGQKPNVSQVLSPA